METRADPVPDGHSHLVHFLIGLIQLQFTITVPPPLFPLLPHLFQPQGLLLEGLDYSVREHDGRSEVTYSFCGMRSSRRTIVRMIYTQKNKTRFVLWTSGCQHCVELGATFRKTRAK